MAMEIYVPVNIASAMLYGTLSDNKIPIANGGDLGVVD